MPDIHPYFKDVNQSWEYYSHLENQLKSSFKLAGKEYINIAKISSKENWEKYKGRIIDMAVKNGKEVLVDIKVGGEEKYWIVDIDYGIIDQFEQFREIGCIQIDVGNAKRLGIKYKDEGGNEKFPVIIHSAIPGGIERYIYMLIDNYKDFPIDFQPVQLRIIPVSEKYVEYARSLVESNSDIRIEIDDRDISVGKRVKMAHEDGIPHHVVVGEKELKLGSRLDVFDEVRRKMDKDVPFIPLGIPYLMSNQIR